MKKCGSILCICVMVLGMLCAAVPVSVSAQTDEGFAYTVLADGTAQITAYAGSATEVTIPSLLDGYTVTEIGAQAFAGCTAVESVVIADSVQNIWYRAFYGCTSLANVTLGNGVVRVCEQAFQNTAYHNDDANWENGVLYIGPCLIEANHTLGGAYAVRQGTTVIADYAFADCTALQRVALPDGVAHIGMRAFEDCSALETVAVPDSVTEFGRYAFYRCGKLQHIHIPAGMKRIEEYTFYKCLSLQNAVIPDGVGSIGSFAFFDCVSLQSVMIPASVTNIEMSAFDECYELADVYYGGDEEQFDAIDIVLAQESSLAEATIHYAVMHGDFNGDGAVNMMDALDVYSLFSMGFFPEEKTIWVDMNGDGTINMYDCLKLFNRVSGVKS